MKAVHFGAGNIGRGFVGLILHNAGYEVVFADVDATVIDALAAAPSYQVHEVGVHPRTWTVDNYRALNSRSDEASVIAEIASADVVTTAVGASILRFVAPVIAAGIAARPAGSSRIAVMACENAINATDILEAEIRNALPDATDEWVGERAVFANTAVDRIVPQQAGGKGLDVDVEDFFEWAIDGTPFGGTPPIIPEAHFVDDLGPYIERKLYTVNAGHATAAYHGFRAGAASIADAVAIPEVLAEVRAVLAETSDYLVAKHGFDRADHAAYVSRVLTRFANPHLPDTPTRVGRSPLRKLGRGERFISPAVGLDGYGMAAPAITRAIGGALYFYDAEDAESVEMRAMLEQLTAEEFVEQVTGLEAGSGLFDAVRDEVDGVKRELAGS
ncbi:mannitol-1-phosphate 5-dehydrogenase [Marisediminicola senii]|uniref:mannitol-1-phosphate 5-dehydrogenase n=1 Tax=Marisediminicola senii TaxID=2711233 RepID=UPI0013EB2462|nr:mannitol-1-phosphate 5-dehydrogenase [Marisediminicola senii]